MVVGCSEISMRAIVKYFNIYVRYLYVYIRYDIYMYTLQGIC